MILSATVHKLDNNPKSIAYATIVIEEGKFKFIVKDIYLQEAEDGSKVLMFPKRNDLKDNNKYISIGFPMNNDTRDIITKVVLEEYDRKYG